MPRLGQVVQRVAHPIFKKRGFGQGRIITDWEKIVGPAMAQYGFPEKVTFPYKKRTEGTVHLVASGSGSMIFQHQSEMIIDQINTYFGYKAVERLRYRVDYVAFEKPVKDKKETELSPQDRKWLKNQLKGWEDSPLKDTLKSFGEAMLKHWNTLK